VDSSFALVYFVSTLALQHKANTTLKKVNFKLKLSFNFVGNLSASDSTGFHEASMFALANGQEIELVPVPLDTFIPSSVSIMGSGDDLSSITVNDCDVFTKPFADVTKYNMDKIFGFLLL
jgi:hypothetical protein